MAEREVKRVSARDRLYLLSQRHRTFTGYHTIDIVEIDPSDSTEAIYDSMPADQIVHQFVTGLADAQLVAVGMARAWSRELGYAAVYIIGDDHILAEYRFGRGNGISSFSPEWKPRNLSEL